MTAYATEPIPLANPKLIWIPFFSKANVNELINGCIVNINVKTVIVKTTMTIDAPDKKLKISDNPIITTKIQEISILNDKRLVLSIYDATAGCPNTANILEIDKTIPIVVLSNPLSNKLISFVII